LVEVKGKHDWLSIHPSIHSNERIFACLFGFHITVILNISTCSHDLDWGNRWNIRVHMSFLIRINLHTFTTIWVWLSSTFIGLAYQEGKDIVFRFIIEYSSIMDFGPYVIGLFLCEDFWKNDILACVEKKLEISYKVIISWRISVSFRGFFEDHIFAWWNIWVSIILLLP
jgi:hypothetical protein